MRLYLSFSRRNLLGIFCFLTAVFLIVFILVSVVNQSKNASTYSERIAFANSLRCEISQGESVKETVIPLKESKAYMSYNGILKSAGYNLDNYKGERVKIYSYNVVSYGNFNSTDGLKLYLIVYKKRIIGGHIENPENAEIMPLKRYKER